MTPLEVDAANCAVTLSVGGSFAVVPDNQMASFDAAGSLAVSVSFPVQGLLVSRIDALTRRPAQVVGSPFAMPAAPASIVWRE